MSDKSGGGSDPPDGGQKPRYYQELAGKAFNQFEAGKYGDAVQSLLELQKQDASDTKIAHNLAVAQMYAGGSVNKLYDVLKASRAAGVDESEDAEEDESETAVLSYNLAVLHYERREFSAAEALLDRVFKVVEAVEESVARRICLLLLDLYIVQHRPEKAALVLQYLERLASAGAQATDGGSADDKKSGGQQLSTTDGGAAADVLKFQLHQYRARLHVMTRSMKACKREIKSALNLSNQSATALFLKSNFEFTRRNYRKAIKLLNSCPKTEPHISGQSLAVMYYNNLAAVHFQMGKYSLASLYYGKAIQANEIEAGRAPLPDKARKPLKTPVADRIFELLYNQGLNYLFLGESARALQCFKATQLLFSHNPRLWLRMAECCVRHYAEKDEKARADLPGSFIKVGTSQNAKTVVRAETSRQGSGSGELDPLSLQTAILYLNNALALLTRGSERTDAVSPSSPPGSPPVAAAGDSSAFALPGTFRSPVQEGDVPVLRCHILASLAYAHLGTSNALEAFRYAEELLAMPNCPGHLKFLGHLYAAESLIGQGKVSLAVNHLAPENVGDLSAAPVTASVGGDDAAGDDENEDSPAASGQVFTAESAKATLLLNLAAAYCMRSDLERAAKALGQVGPLQTGTTAHRQATLLTLYLALSRGDTTAAADIILRNKNAPTRRA